MGLRGDDDSICDFWFPSLKRAMLHAHTQTPPPPRRRRRVMECQPPPLRACVAGTAMELTPTSDEPLPEGWILRRPPDGSRPYYEKVATGETSVQRPSV